MVTDLETPWQNSVVERHGALFKMAFEKSCSLEAPTTEAEVFTFAETNRRVGRAEFSPGQRVFGRQLRLPSSLLEDDFIDPNMIAQDAIHEMRRSEAMRMAAAHGCVVAADRRGMSTASPSRQRKPQRVLVAGEPVFTHRRKDGAQGWCGPGVCVLSEEPKPGRNETVWVHMRNCLHKCNRTQVRPATNEEAEGIETVTSLLPNLTEAVREGRTRHFADITDEGDPEEDEPTVVEGDVMDVRLGRPDSQPKPELNAHANSDATSRSARSETTRSPRPRSRQQPALTWRLEPVIAGFDCEKREIHRDTIWTHPRTGSRWWNRVGKRQDEPRPVNPLFLFIPPKQARPSSNR